MVRATDAHPGLGQLRANAGGPVAKTYPVSQVGKAVVEGMEKRSRWVVVPRWSRALLVLRTALAPLFDRLASETAAEADGLFQQDVDERGAEAASAPIGPGGEAARQREAAGSTVATMAKRDPRMIPLGYGKYVRADRVFALVPLEGGERQDGRRTYVHVDGLTEPVVASRSERAILADVEVALAEAAGLPRRRRTASAGQESLL